MDGSTVVGLIFAGVGVASGVIGTIAQSRLNAHAHGKTAGVIEEGMRGVKEQLTFFKAEVDKRFDNVEKEQDQQWSAIRVTDAEIMGVSNRVAYLEGKVNGKGRAATQ